MTIHHDLMTIHHELLENFPEKLKDEQVQAKIKAFMPDVEFTGYNWIRKRDFEDRYFANEFELWLIGIDKPFKLDDFLSYMREHYATVILVNLRTAADGVTIEMELREFAPGRYWQIIPAKGGYHKVVWFEEDGTLVTGEIDEAGLYVEEGE